MRDLVLDHANLCVRKRTSYYTCYSFYFNYHMLLILLPPFTLRNRAYLKRTYLFVRVIANGAFIHIHLKTYFLRFSPTGQFHICAEVILHYYVCGDHTIFLCVRIPHYILLCAETTLHSFVCGDHTTFLCVRRPYYILRCAETTLHSLVWSLLYCL